MDATSEVKARLNVEDVVSQYVQLKRSGRNFKGLSPFTHEKTASFMVSPEKQIWHDFSSGKGGDIFTFVMEMEGLDFRGALEHLARQAGVELEQFKAQPAGQAKLKSRLAEANDLAAKFYQEELKKSQPALKYLVRQRGFGKGTILGWQLGYSPNGSRALTDHLVKKGFSLTEIRRAGLAVERRGQTIDMFRGRIMIPLADQQGQVIGFTARQLADEPNSPKYINTPATPLYDKSRQVYGLHKAKESIRKSTFVVVVEGNLDVISSHQAGVANVVASAGTAMTQYHLAALKRFTGDIRLSFDGDKAGIAATERIIPLAQKLDIQLKVINLPKLEGVKDPDELVRKDVKLWQKAINDAQYALDWLIDCYRQQLDLTSAQGKKTFTDVLAPTIKRLADPVEQEHYIKRVAKLIGSSEAAVAAKYGGIKEPEIRLKKPRQNVEVDKLSAEHQRLQNHFLAIAWNEPSARELLASLPIVVFEDKNARELAKLLKKNPGFKVSQKLPAALQHLADYVKIIELQFEELYHALGADERLHQAELARRRLVEIYVRLKKSHLAAKMQGAAGNELAKLIAEANRLNSLIKLNQG